MEYCAHPGVPVLAGKHAGNRMGGKQRGLEQYFRSDRNIILHLQFLRFRLHMPVPRMIVAKRCSQMTDTFAIHREIAAVHNVSRNHTLHVPAEAGGKLHAESCKKTYGN